MLQFTGVTSALRQAWEWVQALGPGPGGGLSPSPHSRSLDPISWGLKQKCHVHWRTSLVRQKHWISLNSIPLTFCVLTQGTEAHLSQGKAKWLGGRNPVTLPTGRQSLLLKEWLTTWGYSAGLLGRCFLENEWSGLQGKQLTEFAAKESMGAFMWKLELGETCIYHRELGSFAILTRFFWWARWWHEWTWSFNFA